MGFLFVQSKIDGSITGMLPYKNICIGKILWIDELNPRQNRGAPAPIVIPG